MDNLSKFVDTLNDLMLQRGLSPVDISSATKISSAVIYNWLKKVAIPSTKSLIALADYFHCPIEYLTGRSDNPALAKCNEQQNLPVRLALLMKSKGVSVRKLSSKTGIARSSVSYFLNGSTEPLLENLIKLADFFDCSIDFLVGRE